MELLTYYKRLLKVLFKGDPLKDARILENSLNAAILTQSSDKFLGELNKTYPKFNIYRNNETKKYIVTVKA